MTKKVNYKKIFKSKSKRRKTQRTKTKRTKIKRKKNLSKRKKYNLRGGNNEYKVLRNTMVVHSKMKDTEVNKEKIFKKVLDRCLRENGDYIIQEPPEEQNNTEQNNTEQPIVCKLFVLCEFPENYYYQLNMNECKIRIFTSFIMDKPNGTYMLYEEDNIYPDNIYPRIYTLFLKYDGKVTGHKIILNEDKSLIINSKTINMSPPLKSKIEEVFSHREIERSPLLKSKIEEVFLRGKIIEVIKLLKSEELLSDWPSDATLDTPIDNGIYMILDKNFYHTYDGIVIAHSISVSKKDGKKDGKKTYNITSGNLIVTAISGRGLIDKLKSALNETLKTPITGRYLINKTSSNKYHLYYTDQGIVDRITISKLGEKFSSKGKTENAESLLQLIEILKENPYLNLKTSMVPKYRKHIELDCIHDGTNISLKTNGEEKINITKVLFKELLDQMSSEQLSYTDEQARELKISFKRNRAPTDDNMEEGGKDFLFTQVETNTFGNLYKQIKESNNGFSDNQRVEEIDKKVEEIDKKVKERINFLRQFKKLEITL